MPDGDKDDIRTLLEGAIDGSVTADKPLVEADLGEGTETAPVGETAEQKAERTRDEAGRFAKEPKEKTPRETLTLKAKEPVAPAIKPGIEPLTPEQKAAAKAIAPEIDKEGKHLERIPPPQGWNGGAKIKWDGMPRFVREQIATDYQALATERAEVTPLKELIDANRQLLVNEAGSVPEAFRQMVQFARMSIDNPAALIQHIARAKGVDLRALVGGQQGQPASGQQQPNDPQSVVAQMVQQALQPYVAHIQQGQQQQLQSTVTEIQAFAADPAHPFFNDVSADIKFLLESNRIPPGPPLTRLQQAYDQATWSSPTIRPHLMAAQGEEEAKRKAAQVATARHAQRTSVTGPPLNGGSVSTMDGSDGSIGGDLRAALRSQQGAV